MVLLRLNGITRLIVTGPLTTAGVVPYTEGAELLWIKFRLGTFIPHLPARRLLDREIILPEAANASFWLNSSTWQFPDYDNVETFIDRLAHDDVLVRDPLVNSVLQGQPHRLSVRTVRHRFVQATGLSQGHIRQIERAQQAADLLQQGVPISDVVYQTGYFDQPHLTRALKQWVGYTPGQITCANQPDQRELA